MPLTDRAMVTQAAELAEYADATEDRLWEIHDDLMSRSHRFSAEDLDEIAATLGIAARSGRDPELAGPLRSGCGTTLKAGSRALRMGAGSPWLGD